MSHPSSSTDRGSRPDAAPPGRVSDRRRSARRSSHRRTTCAALLIALGGFPASAEPGAPAIASDQALESMAGRIWTVTLNAAPDRTRFCEAAMRGRNRAAGGDYGVRLRVERDADPVLVVTYAGPRRADVAQLAITLDGRTLGLLPARTTRLGREAALAATLAPDWFARTLLLALQEPDVIGLALVAGGRVFQAPVQGWGTVMRNLDACRARLAR